MPVQAVEFFWLCEECAQRYWLLSDPERGVIVIPLARRGASAS